MNDFHHDLLSLRRNHLFSGLADEEFREVASCAKSVALSSGQNLFSQGDPVDAFYWVADGTIRLFRSSPKGDEKVIDLVSPGQLFAEAAMFLGGRFPVSASAIAETRLTEPPRVLWRQFGLS